KNFKELKKELKLSLRLRNVMNSMKEQQYNDLVKIFEKENNKEILSKYDRDYPSKIIFKLLKEYRVWKLGMGILRSKLF
ncbi:MAG: hypothetical protein KKG75_03175, partial [Nanoarchaeota archaeon]|nr:hypothetical protein [Nanoarchaeota archaeon]